MKLLKRLAVPAALLAILTITTTLFELRGRVPFTSDQALSALMALDILNLGVHPVFYYGAFYGGTVEPHLLAAAFSLLPDTVLTYRLVMGVLLAGFVLVTWLISRRAFGERAGLVSGLYLAVGPSYLLYKGLTSDGAYVSLMLTSALAVYSLLVAMDAMAEDRPAWGALGLCGFFSGLAFWIHLPAAFLLPVLGIAVLIAPFRRWFEATSLAAFAGGVLVGGFPWFIFNIRWNWPSLSTPETAPTGVDHQFAHLVGLAREGWPILLGGGSAWAGESIAWARLAAFALLVAALGAGVVAAFGRDARARRGAILCLACVGTVSALALAVARSDFSEPRYLLCGYIGFAPLVGLFVDRLWQSRKLAGGISVVLLLTLNLASEWKAPKLRHRDPDRDYWGAYELGEVIRELDALGVRSVYASYWTAYRLTFLTHAEVLSSPFGSETHGRVRVPSLCEAVRSAPSHALLLRGEDLDQTRFFLSSLEIPFEERPIGPFVLLRNLPADLGRALVRCARSDPFPTVEVALEGLPDTLASGAFVDTTVRLTNTSDAWVSPTARLAYRWLTHPNAETGRESPRATPRPMPGPGVTVVTPMRILADVAPGEYILVLDLVEENVDWFGDRGGKPVRRKVRVTPS